MPESEKSVRNRGLSRFYASLPQDRTLFQEELSPGEMFMMFSMLEDLKENLAHVLTKKTEKCSVSIPSACNKHATVTNTILPDSGLHHTVDKGKLRGLRKSHKE